MKKEKIFNKLVRDKVQEIIKNNGEIPKTHIASDEEFEIKLKEKLSEEVEEFLKDSVKSEIVDILEVVDALCEHYKFDKEEMEKLKRDKAKKSGKFSKKIILDSVI